MNPEQLKEFFDENPDILVADGFNDAIIGTCTRFGMADVCLYDYHHVIEILQDGGMDYSSAVEYFEYNILGAWMGIMTPCFATLTYV
jgi:hypothetical protein